MIVRDPFEEDKNQVNAYDLVDLKEKQSSQMKGISKKNQEIRTFMVNDYAKPIEWN